MEFLRSIARKHPFTIPLYRSISLFLKEIWFWQAFHTFKSQNQKNRFPVIWKDRYPCLDDNTATTSFDRHYIYHTAWAARILAKTLPKEHTDISSYLYFATITSAFVPINFYDYRPAKLTLPGLKTGHADLMKLPFTDNSIDSLSCMHVIEHIGLGRYGDPMDPEGDLKAINELKRVLAKDGNLLIVVPIGHPKIMFNAHRVYSFDQIKSYFSDLELIDLSLIKEALDGGGLISNPSPQILSEEQYACGCFWFKKRIV